MVAAFEWSRRKGLAAAVITAVWALLIIVLIIIAARETGKGPWLVSFALAAGAITFVTTLFATADAPWGEHWTAWLQRRPMSSVYGAIFAAFGVMTAALALFDSGRDDGPSPPAEDHPKLPPVPRVRSRLPGLWGETGCSVTYRFRIRDRALTVDSVRRPPGRPPHHLIATIVSAEGDVMNVIGEQPPRARGKAATFTYSANGAVERLIWEDRVSPVSLELDRC